MGGLGMGKGGYGLWARDGLAGVSGFLLIWLCLMGMQGQGGGRGRAERVALLHQFLCSLVCTAVLCCSHVT